MTLAVPGATGFVAPAQRAVIKHESALRSQAHRSGEMGHTRLEQVRSTKARG